MSNRAAWIVEVQFSDASYYRVETYYADTARAFARKLVTGRRIDDKSAGLIPYITGTAVFKDYDQLVKAWGRFDPELSR